MTDCVGDLRARGIFPEEKGTEMLDIRSAIRANFAAARGAPKRRGLKFGYANR